MFLVVSPSHLLSFNSITKYLYIFITIYFLREYLTYALCRLIYIHTCLQNLACCANVVVRRVSVYVETRIEHLGIHHLPPTHFYFRFNSVMNIILVLLPAVERKLFYNNLLLYSKIGTTKNYELKTSCNML